MSSAQDHFERTVSDLLVELAPTRPPDRLIPHAEQAVDRARRWPRWLALMKEPPMRISPSVAVGSPMVRIATIMVATLLLALMVAGAGIAGSRLLAADGTIVVDQSGNGTTTTITDAVAMAEDGDTILVRPGTYDESVTLMKDVTIRGDGDRDEVIVELSVEIPLGASGDGPDLPVAFLFDNSDATLENLTVRGESSRIVINGGAPVLRDLVLDGIGRVYDLDPGQPTPTGLGIGDGSTATITNSVLTDTDVDIETGASPSFLGNVFTIGAIWMQGTGVDPVIRDNAIADSVKWGISIGGGARPEVLDNTITGAENGIDVEDTGWLIPDTGTDPVIQRNTVSGAGTGISVSGASATIEDNELEGNENGLAVRGSDAVITGNVIREGRTGVTLSGAGSPILEGNTIEGYEFGLMVGSGTTPTLTDNTICDNEQNLLLSGTAEMPATEGNEICGLEAVAAEAAAADVPDTATVTEVTEVDEGTRDLVIESPSVGTRTVRLILPASWDEEPATTWPVLYLLHGQDGDHTDWTVDTDIVAKTSEELDVLIVMPDGEAGYYSDWWNAGEGGQPMWATFHIEELPAILEADWRASDRRAVAGISMGGFGAMSYAARYPGFFDAAASFSGILDPFGSDWSSDPDLWGDKVEQSDIWAAHDPVSLAPALAGTALYVWAGDGTEDGSDDVVDGFESWLLEHHEVFTGRLAELGIEATTEAASGVHDWVTWDAAFERALPLLLTAIEE